MSKKDRNFIVFGIVVLIGVIGLIWVKGGKGENKELINPSGLSLGSEEENIKQVLYTDESGFSFKYPENYKVEDLTEEAGKEYYTKLEIRENQGSQGDRGDRGKIKMRIEMKDTEYKSVEEWLSKDKEAPESAKLKGAVELDGVAAVQYETENKLFTAAIDQGVLYFIGSEKENKAVYNLLVSSFNFEEEADTGGGGASGSSGGGGNVIYEEEEVVE
jgi:hypothetical protein